MKNVIGALLVALLLSSTLGATILNQTGASGSGRSASRTLRLESIVGQSFSGRAQDLTAGFLAVIDLRNYVAGDVDGNGLITISDAVALINYIFSGGAPPASFAAADADCSGTITISDAVYLINYIFAGGPGPSYCK